MDHKLSLAHKKVFAGAFTAVLVVVILVRIFFFKDHPAIFSLAITCDLLLFLPFLYFLFIRKTKIHVLTVVPVLVLSMALATFILPEGHRQYIDLFKQYGFPVIETTAIIFIITKVTALTKKYKHQTGNPDFFTILIEIFQRKLPSKLVYPVASEIAALYYSFFAWKSKKAAYNEFTYHRKGSAYIVSGVAIFAIAIETIALHLLIMQWSGFVAWIFSALSIYAIIQITGFLKSMSRRLIVIRDNCLFLYYGFWGETAIRLDEIQSVEHSTSTIKETAEILTLSPFGKIESHNIIIHLKSEHCLTGIYGLKKMYRSIALHIDDRASFTDFLKNCIA